MNPLVSWLQYKLFLWKHALTELITFIDLLQTFQS